MIKAKNCPWHPWNRREARLLFTFRDVVVHFPNVKKIIIQIGITNKHARYSTLQSALPNGRFSESNDTGDLNVTSLAPKVTACPVETLPLPPSLSPTFLVNNLQFGTEGQHHRHITNILLFNNLKWACPFGHQKDTPTSDNRKERSIWQCWLICMSVRRTLLKNKKAYSAYFSHQTMSAYIIIQVML